MPRWAACMSHQASATAVGPAQFMHECMWPPPAAAMLGCECSRSHVCPRAVARCHHCHARVLMQQIMHACMHPLHSLPRALSPGVKAHRVLSTDIHAHARVHARPCLCTRTHPCMPLPGCALHAPMHVGSPLYSVFLHDCIRITRRVPEGDVDRHHTLPFPPLREIPEGGMARHHANTEGARRRV